jgi:hypothetical protein
VICGSGCGGGGGSSTALLPQEAGGWTLSGEVEVFGPESLFDHINGGAEVYLDKGFRELTVGQYVLTEGAEAMAEVYAMETPSAAAEMFSLEQGAGDLNGLGEEASAGSQSVAFRRGTSYVKIIAYTPGEGIREKLLELARSLDGRLTER